MEFIYLLILTLLATVEAVPMMRVNIQENVNFGYPITPMYYYFPYLSPYSPHQLIDPVAFTMDGPSGMESKLSLSDKTLGLFSTTDDDKESVVIHAYPVREFIDRIFGIFRPIRFWIMGNKPVNTASVPTVINNPGVSLESLVDNENESVIIEAGGYQLLK